MKNEIPKWLEEEVASYDVVMSPGPGTVLDIGANVGAFALRARALWPEAAIRCYEPELENYQGLVRNTSCHARIQAYRFAVRSFNGTDKILIGDQGVTCGFHQLGRQTNVRERVMCVDAEEIPSADLVKIDTEGCEVEIVSRLDLSKTRALVLEYHRPEDAAVLKTLAVTAGFELLEEKSNTETNGILKFGREGVRRVGTENGQRIGAAQERKIYCAVASHFSNHDLVFLQSMMQLILGASVRISFGWSCDPSVERARNVLTANFLATDCTHLLFVDSDIAFTPRDVARIISHNEDVVGGIYPLKTMDQTVKWCGNGTSESEKRKAESGNDNHGSTESRIAEVRPDGLQEVGCIGTGFMCIARRALERIIAADGSKICYRQDWPPHREEFAFWRQTIRNVNGRKRFLTEDWNFCYRYRELGGKVFADTQVILRHVGRAVWPLDLQQGNPFVINRPGPQPATAMPPLKN
jgi:FkbM family methyltransferase